MGIAFDAAKQLETLTRRGLDFADAGEVFDGKLRIVVLVWTPRNGARRIISMRYRHEHEERRWFG